MDHALAYLAGFGCSICYGFATIFELIAAKQQERITSLHPHQLISLFKKNYYLIGIALDFIGWLLFLVSSQKLPLFLSMSFVAFSLVVTAIASHFIFKTKTHNKDIVAILFIVIALTSLSFVAKPSGAGHVSRTFSILLKLMPIALGFIGYILLKLEDKKYVALALAALAGICFGATGLIARVIQFDHFNFKSIFQIYVLSLIVYGILGAIFLAAAMQKESINRINCALYSVELIVPSLIGLLFLQDKAKSGLWPVMVISLLVVVAATIVVALDSDQTKAKA
jgi:drug/metabolite transporter (DMT)-like permease